jgi:hypothetical protein
MPAHCGPQTLRSKRIGIQSPPRAEGPFKSEKQAKGEEKSNRNNPTFRNRRNPMKINYKAFSNRNKNTCFASPHFRPHDLLCFLCLSACTKLHSRCSSREVH